MAPLVSILVPAYNAEKWIADALSSALAQMWPNKEIIVVDDGSGDDTFLVARRFESPSLKIITQPNQGASAARNKAFSLCQGDYIQWLDADDLLGPEKIARQMEAAASAGKRMLLSSAWGCFHYRPGKARFIPTALWRDLDSTEWLLRKWEGNLYMQTASWLVSRELTEAAGAWDTRLLGDDDGEYFCRVIRVSHGIRFVPQSRVYYRIMPSNRLSLIGQSNRKIEAHFLGMKLQIKYLLACEDSDRARAACVKYLQRWLGNFYPNRPDIVREAQQLAASMGGRLSLPKASWKYAWIEKLFGFGAAKRSQLYYNRLKSSALRKWDRLMLKFDQRSRFPT